MKKHVIHSISPISIFRSFWLNRYLIAHMTWREVAGRYKGSILGILWSFINPIIMLAIYTFIFSVVFKAKWGIESSSSKTDFALILFVGLIFHSLLSEVINKAPILILSNSNYVKKILFPLEILTIVSLFGAIFHLLMNIIVLFVAFFIINGYLNWTIMFLPLLIFPFSIFILGVAWVLTSIGAYFRDINQTIGVITTILLFVAPIFFPITAIPENIRPLLFLNPLTFVVEQARALIVFGVFPDLLGVFIYWALSIIVFWSGYTFFQRTREGFADVL